MLSDKCNNQYIKYQVTNQLKVGPKVMITLIYGLCTLKFQFCVINTSMSTYKICTDHFFYLFPLSPLTICFICYLTYLGY